MRRLILYLFFFSLLKLTAQSTLSYSVFISNVKNNHPMVRLAGAVGQIGKESLTAARGNYDPQVSGMYSNKNYQGREYYTVFESEIKQAIFTNQSIKAGYEYGSGPYLNSADYTPGGGLAYVGIEASLLQGLIIDKRRAEVLKARQYRDINENEKRHITNTVLFETASNYVEWLLKKSYVKVNRYFTNLAQVRLEGITAMAFAGERPAIDTTETSMLLQQRTLDYQSALVEFQKQSALIAINNWSEKSAESFDPQLIPEDSLEILLDIASTKFLQDRTNEGINNPLLLQYRSKVNLLDIERKYRSELIKPVLNVNYNLLSLPVNTNDFPSLSLNNYKWGAQFAMPLFLRNSRAEANIAKLERNSMQFEYELKQTEIRNKLQFMSSNINVFAAQIQTASKNAEYSKLMLEAEKLKFENGESSVFLINARENYWLAAEFKRLESMSKYIKAVLEYIYLKGTMDYL